MNNIIPLKFDLEAAQKASDEWGSNCGPGALAAVLGMTLDEVRPHLGNFESKHCSVNGHKYHYMNPKLMIETLKRLNVNFKLKKEREYSHLFPDKFGLARVQWEGPWTEPDIPRRKRYRHTHWVGSRHDGLMLSIFDINCINMGGWIPVSEWIHEFLPWLLKECEPEANGKWHLTHVIEINTEN